MDRWQVPGDVRGDEQRGQGAEIVTVEGGTLGDCVGVGRERVKRSLLGQVSKAERKRQMLNSNLGPQTPECRKDSVAVDEKLKGFQGN